MKYLRNRWKALALVALYAPSLLALVGILKVSIGGDAEPTFGVLVNTLLFLWYAVSLVAVASALGDQIRDAGR